jgi:tetratricopeptide (TPR) repeat protein
MDESNLIKPENQKIKETTVKEMANRINPKSPYYKHQVDSKIHFACFLGAGASIESKIPSANDMINEFVDIICETECPERKEIKEKEDWVRSKKYFENAQDKYSLLFERCFPKAVARRDYIESKVEGKTPSLGYIALAHLLDKKIIDTIVTTNFDDLVYQACTSFTNKRPIVFSLGGFASEVSANISRPKILKIHGDFMFSRLNNTKEEIEKQDPNMSTQVKQILESYDGLIVIGYAGNDESIIDLLKNIPKEKYLYWCVYKDEKVNSSVEKLLLEKEGWIVRTDGFDKLMDEIRKISGIEDSHIFQLFEERKTSLIKEVEKFSPVEYEKFAKEFDLALKANEKGIDFLIKRNFSEAEECCREAIKISPNFAVAHNNLAILLSKDKNSFIEAEKEFKVAIKLMPKEPMFKINYAYFLVRIGSNLSAILLCEEAKSIDGTFSSIISQLAIDKYINKPRVAVAPSDNTIPNWLSKSSPYDLACYFAIRENKVMALKYLKNAINNEPILKSWADYDLDFDWIRDDSEFKNIIGIIK